jgi:hypothetical protein
MIVWPLKSSLCLPMDDRGRSRITSRNRGEVGRVVESLPIAFSNFSVAKFI